ncbi:AraC family transcriptional regulator [Flaviramulus sp. BrNp1-15]|uniref:AraC family transcriptional regulator n=1 Tax=Flaviramulus sp. BrNp1-15 TaxID=2916754 RepID=UPI001EE94D3F|nr:AraC family transcriptional regulator [Flaviramulus sp. BrNp1-15]ULC60773.1 AraC family transcriptional regulator [Flaviramulus sp. BrNp1-15]
MSKCINREITQLRPDDSFFVIKKIKHEFDFPIHFHPEFEINFIRNGKGIRRIVGNSIEEMDDVELTLIGSNLEHGWETYHCQSKEINEITILFHEWLFNDKLFTLKTFKPIKDLLDKAKEGVNFSKEIALKLLPKLEAITNQNKVSSFTELLLILEELALTKDFKLLSESDHEVSKYENSKKLKKVHDFVHKNYCNKISLTEISNLVNMSNSSFNRFIKDRTGKTFISYINDVRLIYASKFLIDSDFSISEICYKCGYNNIANFNRVFKKCKNKTPSEYRNTYRNIRKFTPDLQVHG